MNLPPTVLKGFSVGPDTDPDQCLCRSYAEEIGTSKFPSLTRKAYRGGALISRTNKRGKSAGSVHSRAVLYTV